MTAPVGPCPLCTRVGGGGDQAPSQRHFQVRHLDGLADVIVHADGQTLFALTLQCVKRCARCRGNTVTHTLSPLQFYRAWWGRKSLFGV